MDNNLRGKHFCRQEVIYTFKYGSALFPISTQRTVVSWSLPQLQEDDSFCAKVAEPQNFQHEYINVVIKNAVRSTSWPQCLVA